MDRAATFSSRSGAPRIRCTAGARLPSNAAHHRGSGEEITTLPASPVSCANDGDDDEDEEDEEEDKKKGDEDDEEEEEPVWTAPNFTAA